MGTSAFRPALCVAAGVAALTGCSLWPWSAQPAGLPVPVNELIESVADGTPTHAFPQYWKRNTLVIDMRAAASAGGSFLLKRPEGGTWPARLALRVMPGSLGLIEVQADQRLLMPVTGDGTQAVDLELVPGVYTQSTPQIVVKWQPAGGPAT